MTGEENGCPNPGKNAFSIHFSIMEKYVYTLYIHFVLFFWGGDRSLIKKTSITSTPKKSIIPFFPHGCQGTIVSIFINIIRKRLKR